MNGFIYVLKCPLSGAVRYVGKCNNLKNRIRQHISESKLNQAKSHKSDWIRSLLKHGARPVIEIDVVVNDGEDWKQIEIARVAHYKALGCDLTNATLGGDGAGPLTEEGRRILSERASAQFGTPEGRKRQAEHMRSLCADPEFRRARDLAAKKTRSTAAYKARMSEMHKRKWMDPTFREKSIASRRAICSAPAYREKLSRSLSVFYSRSPDAIAALAERTRTSWADPEIRAKKIAAMRAARRPSK